MGRNLVGVGVALALLSSSVVEARSKKLDEIERWLAPAEQAQFLNMWTALVDATISAARTANHECKVGRSVINGESTLLAPKRAFAVPDGLAPEFRTVRLDCDATADGDAPLTISLSAEMLPRLRAFVLPKKSLSKRGSHGWWLSTNGESMFLDSDVPGSGHAHAALRVRIAGERRAEIEKALMNANLKAQLQQFVPLRVPMPKPVPAIAPGPDADRGVVGTIVQLFAGADGGVVVSDQPVRSSMEIDAKTLEWLHVSTPDLEPSLFASFIEGRQSDSLPALPANATLEDQATLRRVFDAGGWDEFHKVYPGASGVLRLSPIAYSADGSQAVLVVSYSAGPLYGHGALFVLQREPTDSWTVIYERVLWMS